MRIPILTALLIAGFLAQGHAAARDKLPDPPSNFIPRPAVFHVGTDIVNPDLQAFTLTAGYVGNSMLMFHNGGFEPYAYRDQIWVGTDADNRIIPKSSNDIHGWDSWHSGYLDGAEVRVYRVIDQRMVLVRQDTIARTEISFWDQANKPVGPEATSYQFNWNNWSRPESVRWFTIMAMDAAGNLSEPATPVRVQRPDGEQGKANNQSIRFKQQKRSDDTQAPLPPRNLSYEISADNVVHLSWEPSPSDDVAAYVFARSDTDPAQHKGVYLQLAGEADSEQEQIRAGDLVIVGKTITNFDRSYRSHRGADSWRAVKNYYPDLIAAEFFPDAIPGKTWRLLDHAEDSPVEDPGITYLEVTLRAGDEELFSQRPSLDGTEQDWYNVLENAEYTVELWLKADRADAPPVKWQAIGAPELEAIIGSAEFQPGTEWRKFTHTFQGQVIDKARPTRLGLILSGPATYSMDNYRVYRSDVPYLDLLPYEYERLKSSGMTALRTHAPIKTRTTTYSMDQFTNPPGVIQGVSGGNTLGQQLAIIDKAKVDPWLQIEYHMSPDEWLAFVEFMVAPYDPATDSPENKPYAYKRYSQGRQAPWTDAFERIYFEISNETWNWSFKPWVFEGMVDAATGENHNRGRVYGMFNEMVIETLRSSPFWSDAIEAKFIHMLGGWNRSNYGEEAVYGCPSAHYMTIAAYNGGWDEGEGPPQTTPASYFNVLNQVNQTATPAAIEHAEEAVQWRAAGHDVQLGTYEAGPGYALNGLHGTRVTQEQAIEQELVMKSKLSGTATLDSFLTRAYFDFDSQNFFTLSEGRTWSSHTKWYRGGQAYPCFLVLELFNHQGRGDMLQTRIGSVSTYDGAKYRRRSAVEGAPLAAVFATRQGQRVNLFIVSRMVPGYPDPEHDGHQPVTVHLPFTTAESITLHRMTGAMTDNNIYDKKVALETLPLASGGVRLPAFRVDAETGADERGLPPGETLLYVFEGTDIANGRVLPLEEVVQQKVTYTP